MNTLQPVHGMLITSVPKCGTFLLRSLLLALPGTTPGPNLMADIPPGTPTNDRPTLHAGRLSLAGPTDVSISHCHYSAANVAALDALPHHRLFLLRDPRDFIVSYIDYVLDPKENHFHHDLFANHLTSDNQRIRAMIVGVPGDIPLPGVRDYFSLFWGWLTDANTHIVRYEELVDDASCRQAMVRIMRWLGFDVDDVTMSRVLETGREPQRSPTYRVGRPGRWRDRFTPDLINFYDEHVGDLDARLGYANAR
ncbi:MAG: sulfotransferase domain-containing protein [Phycisphaerales bacterium]|nr:sulfotransferase domain-containing protein [Phycisphaerales bacterium]